MELVKFHAQGSELVIETATEFNEFSWWYKMYLEVRAVLVMGVGCISVIPHETMFTGSAQEKSSGLLQVPVTLPVMNSITYQCLMPLKVISHYCTENGNPKARTQVTCFVACFPSGRL